MKEYTHKIKNRKLQRQNGAVLVVGLVMLTVLFLIGITAITMTIFSEKLTRNQRNKELAFQASESALSDAENWIISQSEPPETVSSCLNPPCDVWAANSFTNWLDYSHAWWLSTGRSFDSTLESINTLPRYIIEYQSFVPYELDPDARSKGKGYYHYLISTRGTGSTDEASVVLQSVYSVQFR